MVAWSAREGTALVGTTVYCTHKPCLSCAKLLANAGIVGLCYSHDYDDLPGLDGADLLTSLGISVTRRWD